MPGSLVPDTLPAFLAVLPLFRNVIIFWKSFMVEWSVVPACLSPPGDWRVGALVKILAVDFLAAADFLSHGVNLESFSAMAPTLAPPAFLAALAPLLAPPTTLALEEEAGPAWSFLRASAPFSCLKMEARSTV